LVVLIILVVIRFGRGFLVLLSQKSESESRSMVLPRLS